MHSNSMRNGHATRVTARAAFVAATVVAFAPGCSSGTAPGLEPSMRLGSTTTEGGVVATDNGAGSGPTPGPDAAALASNVGSTADADVAGLAPDAGPPTSDAGSTSGPDAAGSVQDAGPLPGSDGGATQPSDAATGSSVITLFGGGDYQTVVSDTWEWDGTNWTQRTPAVGPSARTGSAMAPLGDKVVLFGGSNGVVALGDTWEWDGTVWTQLDIPGPPPRAGHLMAAFEGKIVLFGGQYWSLNVTNNQIPYPNSASPITYSSLVDLWEFDGAEWTVLDDHGPIGGWGLASLPLPPSGQCDSSCPSEQLMVFGAGDAQNDTWTWDGSWTQVDVAASNSTAYPPPGQGMLSRLGNAILLLQTSPVVGTTTMWQWGDAWTQIPVTEAPSAYGFPDPAPLPGSSLDGVGQPTLGMAAFGDEAVLLDDNAGTWVWSAGAWTQPSPATSPSARTGYAMATRSLSGSGP